MKEGEAEGREVARLPEARLLHGDAALAQPPGPAKSFAGIEQLRQEEGTEGPFYGAG